MLPLQTSASKAAATGSSAPKPEAFHADLATGRFYRTERSSYFAAKSLNLPLEGQIPKETMDRIERSRPGEDFKPTARAMVFAKPLGPNQAPKDRQFDRIQFINAQDKSEVHKVLESEIGQNNPGEKGLGWGLWTEDKNGKTAFFEMRNLTPFGQEPKAAAAPAQTPRRRLTAPPERSAQGAELKAPLDGSSGDEARINPGPARSASLRTAGEQAAQARKAKVEEDFVLPEWAQSRPSVFATDMGERAPRRPIEKPKEVAWADAQPSAAPVREARPEYVPDCPRPEPVDSRRRHDERMTPAAEAKWNAFYGLLEKGWHPARAARHDTVGDANYRAVRGQKDHFEIRLDGSNRAIFHVDPADGRVSRIQVGGHLD